ncbi:hypothetical protein [Actinomyces ruminis]|uniref:hypothetical protein n=1 Tax=Actinomyces ruminis TaxID=1937003 RepID=UPI001177DFDE|nr:hypothetical protein [Actinomyces ruminis]
METMGGPWKRRTFFLGVALGVLSAGCGCSQRGHSTPQGWYRVAHGCGAFDLKDGWQEVDIPDDANLLGWDYVVQDTAEFGSEDTRLRLGAMTNGGYTDYLVYPPESAEDLASDLAGFELFGKYKAKSPNPTRMEGVADEIWRIDYPNDDDPTSLSYLFTAKDDGYDEMLVVG